MNWWQWLLFGAGICAAWFVIGCAFAWVITRPLRRPAPGSGTPPVREAALPVRPLVPGLDWTMSTHWAACGCIHFLDHRSRKKVITQCREHEREFSVREWNERLGQS